MAFILFTFSLPLRDLNTSMEEACGCAICHDTFIDCVETPCCSVGYCRECISSYITKMRKGCPVCKKAVQVKDLKKNALAQRIADAMPMGSFPVPLSSILRRHKLLFNQFS